MDFNDLLSTLLFDQITNITGYLSVKQKLPTYDKSHPQRELPHQT